MGPDGSGKFHRAIFLSPTSTWSRTLQDIPIADRYKLFYLFQCSPLRSTYQSGLNNGRHCDCNFNLRFFSSQRQFNILQVMIVNDIKPVQVPKRKSTFYLPKRIRASVRIVSVAVAPERVAPAARIFRRSSRVRTPPAHFTSTLGPECFLISSISSTVAPL